ncbi:MAG: hypothetical protein ACTSU0_11815, partial [Alphaproteobacteria bacterium]
MASLLGQRSLLDAEKERRQARPLDPPELDWFDRMRQGVYSGADALDRGARGVLGPHGYQSFRNAVDL